MLNIGTRVFLKNFAPFGVSPGKVGLRGIVVGHGVLHRDTEAQPTLLVQLDEGAYLEGEGAYKTVFISTVVCAVDNVAVDEE